MKLATLWIGDSLGDIESASARSFIQQGNKLTLYTYGVVNNIPDGVEVKDANEILEAKKILRVKKTGSPALHADLFRYQLLKKTDCLWVDLDVLAFKKFDFKSNWVFAYENTNIVNNAILKLPKESKTLKELLKVGLYYKGMPFHLKGFKKIKYKIKSFFKRGLSLEDWPWGAMGPKAVTHFLKKTGEIENALPKSTFYYIDIQDIDLFLRPNGLTVDDFPSDAFGVHLWAKELKQLIDKKYNGKIPSNSFLEKFM